MAKSIEFYLLITKKRDLPPPQSATHDNIQSLQYNLVVSSSNCQISKKENEQQ